jgi:hypothetical protein
MNSSRQMPGEQLASTAREQLSDAAKPAIEQTKLVVQEQKSVSAVKGKTIAKAMHRAAEELQPQLPFAADYIRSAATLLEEASSALETRSLGELRDTFRSFARNRSGAVFGAAMLAGFAMSRFLKSSAKSAARVQGGT